MVDLMTVKNKVQLLASCYPQLQWDGSMTAGAWFAMLNEINATEEELENACKYIITNGYESWKVNIALIISLIREDRDIKNNIKKSQEYLGNLDKITPISKEKFKEYKNKLFKELYGDEKKI